MRTIKFLTAFFIVCGLFGCSGGGDGEDTENGGLRTNACDVLGLKIINGGKCDDAGASVVRYDVLYTNGQVSSCSGTMISSVDVLTAGHCFLNLGRDVQAIAVSADNQTIEASGFAIHPEYAEQFTASLPGGAGIFNDVAVVRLGSPVSLTPVPLYTSRAVQPNDIISIFGYGIDDNGDIGTLRSGEMLVSQVLESHLVSNYTGAGSNTCEGDSGGPAILTFGNTTGVVGITSTGDPNAACLAGDISLFANVQSSKVLSFILDVVPSAAQI